MKHGPRTILLKLLTILLSGSPCQWWTRQQVTAGPIHQQSLLRRLTLHAQLLSKATSALTVELVGINQFQMFAMVNIKKNSCPIGYKKKMDQVISLSPRDGVVERAPGPGLKQQAPSVKLQAPSFDNVKRQASSPKQQASSAKPEASSSMIREPRNI